LSELHLFNMPSSAATQLAQVMPPTWIRTLSVVLGMMATGRPCASASILGPASPLVG